MIGYEPSDHVFLGDKVESGIVEIDALGERCPIPVQRVRRALRDCPEGSTIVLIGDDPESSFNSSHVIERWPGIISDLTNSLSLFDLGESLDYYEDSFWNKHNIKGDL